MTIPLLRCAPDDDADIRRVAVTPEGRRDPAWPVVTAISSLSPGALVLLEHAGPAASRWSLERAAALDDDVVDPMTGRRARRLDDDGRARIRDAFAVAAAHVRRLGGRPICAAFDDDLLHRGISPLGGGGGAVDDVLAIMAACAPCELLLTIEDLAPGGLGPTAGLALARRAVAAAQSTMLIAAGGTGWLEPLRARRKGRQVDRRGLGLASAAWATGVLPVPVWGCVRGDVDASRVLESAERLGLAGVIQVPPASSVEAHDRADDQPGSP